MAMSTYWDAIRIISLCSVWYAVSSVNNVVGKIILSDFPYPMTLTMAQLVSITIYTMPLLKLWDIAPATMLPLKYWFSMILPLACGKFFASVSSHISIWKVPVSYAHTVKATMPLFTVLITRFYLKEKQTTEIYICLLPIVGGVAIATISEVSFDVIGLASALCATTGFAVLNIFSKKCLKETGIHHLRLLYVLASLCTVFFTPIWMLHDLTAIVADTSLQNSIHLPALLALMVIDGVCAFGQNLVAFTIIAMVSPLSYAVANATKRICIVTVSLLTLRNPVTSVNIFGMSMAIFGVLLYNKAKLSQNKVKKGIPVLPYSSSVSNLDSLQHNGIAPSLLLQHQRQQGSMYNEKIFLDKHQQNGHVGSSENYPNGAISTGVNVQAESGDPKASFYRWV